jgi:hypothetical protein
MRTSWHSWTSARSGYPFHDTTITVTHCGRICFKGQKVNLGHAFAGQNVGVTQVGERIWLVSFMQYDLGYFDDETCRLEPIENPFGPKVLPIPQLVDRSRVTGLKAKFFRISVLSSVPAGRGD